MRPYCLCAAPILQRVEGEPTKRICAACRGKVSDLVKLELELVTTSWVPGCAHGTPTSVTHPVDEVPDVNCGICGTAYSPP